VHKRVKCGTRQSQQEWPVLTPYYLQLSKYSLGQVSLYSGVIVSTVTVPMHFNVFSARFLQHR